MAINSQGLLNIYKKNNGLKNLINEFYISSKSKNIKKKLLHWKWNIFMMRNINFKSNLRKNINNLDVKINNNITKHQAQQNRNKSQILSKAVNNIEKPAFDKKLYFKNKWFKEQKKLLEAEEYIKKKKKALLKKQVLLKFIAIKKIMSVIRIIKLFKELKKNENLSTICYWFYKCFINFKFNTFSRKIMFNVKKNKEIKKVKRYSLLLKKVNKKINHNSRMKLIGPNKRRFAFLKFLKGNIRNKIKASELKYSFLKKKKNILQDTLLLNNKSGNKSMDNIYRNKNIKFFSNKIVEFNSVKKKKHKKILNWIIHLYNKLDKHFRIKTYMHFILRLKKKLINLFRNKIVDNIYFNFDNNIFLTKTNVYYKFLGDMVHEHSNLSRVRRMHMLRSKKRIILKKSTSFKKMHNFFKKRKRKFNIFSFLCRGHILLSGEDRILHKFQGSKFGKSLRKIWNTYLLKGKRLWSEDDFLIFTQNGNVHLSRKRLNRKKIRKGLNRVVLSTGSIRRLQNRRWHRYMFNAGDLQNNFKISFLKRIRNVNNKKKR